LELQQEKIAERRRERELLTSAERDAIRKQKEIDDLTKDQRTIFVSQLTKKVMERDLENFFGQIGKVKNVIMVRDKFSGAHKGFAYVEMETLQSVPVCLLFNNVVPDFQKYAILVKPSEAEKNFVAKKDPFSQKNSIIEPGTGPDSRIYVGNIHVSIDEPALTMVLEQFGPVESLKLHRDHLGNSKGFAFVKYAKAESAMMAMAALPGIELVGRPLKAGPVTDNRGDPNMMVMANAFANDPTNTNWKLDADEGGAGLALNPQSRLQLMAKLGAAAGLTVPIPASVAMTAASVLSTPLPTTIAAPPKIPTRVEGIPSRCLLISNMFDPTSEHAPNWDREIREDVVEECSSFGHVEHCHVETQRPGGLVFVKLSEIDAATKAATALNGRYFAGRTISVSYLEENKYAEMMK
jgi:RNA-binding protein 23/39